MNYFQQDRTQQARPQQGISSRVRQQGDAHQVPTQNVAQQQVFGSARPVSVQKQDRFQQARAQQENGVPQPQVQRDAQKLPTQQNVVQQQMLRNARTAPVHNAENGGSRPQGHEGEQQIPPQQNGTTPTPVQNVSAEHQVRDVPEGREFIYTVHLEALIAPDLKFELTKLECMVDTNYDLGSLPPSVVILPRFKIVANNTSQNGYHISPETGTLELGNLSGSAYSTTLRSSASYPRSPTGAVSSLVAEVEYLNVRGILYPVRQSLKIRYTTPAIAAMTWNLEQQIVLSVGPDLSLDIQLM